jgi:rhodanese-related sulfurtransferase
MNKLAIILSACASLSMLTQSAVAQTNPPDSKASKPGEKAESPRKVNVEAFDKLRQDKANVVLDVRTKKEFDAGHIPGAVNIDYRGSSFEQQLSTLDKNKVYLVHCAAGVRSAHACEKMNQMGFKQLYDLAPGFRAWEKAGKPVEK